MFKSEEKSMWFRSFFLCIAAGAAAIAGASPAVADYRRSCHFVIEVDPTGTGLENVNYSFRVFNTVEHRIQANDGRRVIRQRVTNCVLGHWNDRNETRPYACQDWERVDMSQYPFDNMFDKIRLDICDKNRDELRLPVNIDMYIRGERGCLEHSEDRGVDPAAHVSIASNFSFNCPAREGGASEMGPPSAPPLPNTRLPGMDIGSPQPVGSWQECWRLCQQNDACQAWTFRPAGTWGRAEALCLLKSGVPAQVSDSCCVSGTKN